ncbi:hypothetical protein [Methylomagnum sp.]
MEESQFAFDVFLSHSAKDKDVVRPIAERLRGMGCGFGLMSGNMKCWFAHGKAKYETNSKTGIFGV